MLVLLQFFKLYADIALITVSWRLHDTFRWFVRFTLVGLRSLYPDYQPDNHCGSDLIPAPQPGTCEPGATSRAGAFLPFLVVADNRHVDLGMGVRTPQAPCPL